MISRRSAVLGAASFAVAAPAKADKLHEVKIHRFKFQPATLEVKAGEVVRWINLDLAPHTATSNENDWDTGALSENDTAEIVFEAGMGGAYFCAFHPHMKAEISVS